MYHILLIPSWYPAYSDDVSGVFFREQALALHNYGHKVGVVAPIMRPLHSLFSKPSKSYSIKYEIDSGVVTYRQKGVSALPLIPYGNYWLFEHYVKKLFREYIEREGKPDIIHAHASIYAGATAMEIGQACGTPVVMTEHSTGFARGIYTQWQLKLALKAIHGCCSCITVSPGLGNLLSDQFDLPKEIWQWVPNVVANRFKAPNVTACCGQRSVRFLNLALMTAKKGQSDLIKAFHIMVKEGLSAELWLAGDGPIRVELEKLAAELGVARRVRFLGLIEPKNVPKLLSKVDVMVVASHYETFGVVAAEGLMAGLPVIATRCGGPECIVGDGDGLLVPPKQPVLLGQAMGLLCKTLHEYDRKGIAKRAKKRFSGPAVATQLTDIYQNIVSGKE